MKKSIIGSVLFVLILSTVIFGQGTSRITGVVKDTTSAIIPGATVAVRHEGTNISSKMTSTSAGIYVFDGMQLGSYTLTVEMNGFKKYISQGNILTLGVPLTINAAMEAGAVNETVEVSGTYERVQTSTSGNFGTTVDNKALVSLPLGLDATAGGRNPLTYVRLQPGVVGGANTGGGTHVNGSRDRAFNFTLDGIDINETSAGGAEFSPLRTNPDSLQEIRVITGNATADQGRNSGAQVMLVTKSGTNQIHGNLFYFHRNSALSANEWENNLKGLKKPPLRQHQFGGDIGGPIFKNRTFYFFNTQIQRQITPILTTRNVYTATARQGVFRYVRGGQNSTSLVDGSGNPRLPACAGSVTTNCIASINILSNDPRPTKKIDPTIQSKVLNLALTPNDYSVGDGLNTAGYTFLARRTDPQKDFVFKIDHKFNDSNSIFGRYAWGTQETLSDTLNGGAPAFPGLPAKVNTTRDPKNLAAGHKWVVNQNTINEFTFGFNKFNFNFINPSAGDDPYSIVTLNITDPMDFTAGNARGVNTYQFADNLTYVRSAHTFKTGLNFRYQQHKDTRGTIAGVNANTIVNLGGTINPACRPIEGGAGIDGGGKEFFCLTTPNINSNDYIRLEKTINDLLGRVESVTQGFAAKDDFSGYQPGGSLFLNDARYGEYDFYFQDTWKLKSNLTIDLGLRYEAKLTPSAASRLYHPDKDLFVGAKSTDKLEWIKGELYDSDMNNFLPSLGFAWDPWGSGKTVIRANYRLAADRINTFVLSNAIFNNIPGVTTLGKNTEFGVKGGRVSDGIPSVAPVAGIIPDSFAQPAAFGTGGITVVDPSFRTPMTNQWGLSIQHDFGKNFVVEMSYIGRRASSLFGAYDANQIDLNRSVSIRGGDYTFLNEFKKVKSDASYDSPLFNELFKKHSGNTAANGTAFFRSQYKSDITNNNVGAIAANAASRNEAGKSLMELSGLPANMFRAFPQFGQAIVIDSNDYSTYHALQLTATRKFSNGVTFQAAYTFGKSLDSRSFDPAFTTAATGNVQAASSTPFDINRRYLNYARSDFDRTHVINGYAVWDLPIGKNGWIGNNASPWFNKIIDGWQANGYFILQSGRPFTVYSGYGQFSNIVNSTVNCNGCSKSMGEVVRNSTNFKGIPAYFTSEEIAKLSQPGLGETGNTGRNFFTGPGLFNVDMAILKKTKFGEGKDFELRFEFFNILNHANFGFPTSNTTGTSNTSTNLSSTNFGRINDSVASTSRKIRIGAKINF